MSKLLSAGYVRLFKSKLLWWLTGGFGIFALFFRLNQDFEAKSTNAKIPLDTGFFAFALVIGIALAIFTSIFVGVEYSDGTLRNKLVVGHSRPSVYFSNLILCSTAGMIFAVAYMIMSFAIGAPLFGMFTLSAAKICTMLFASLVLVVAYSSLFVMLAMINQNKAAVAIISVILSFILLFSGNFIYSALNEPEYYDAYSYTENGVTHNEPKQKNPNYLTGTKRQVYEFFYDFDPGCQSMRIAGMYDEEINDSLKLGGYSFICIVITSAVGILVFKRKDLK